jgi:hypothetical protein
MSGYIEAGYAIVLGSLALYGTTLLARERSARRRSDGVARHEETREPVGREES